jgi:hypothetical protein
MDETRCTESVCDVKVADDQNTASLTRRFEFVAAVYVNGQTPCLVCAGWDNQRLCSCLPCSEYTRNDGRDGYFREVLG